VVAVSLKKKRDSSSDQPCWVPVLGSTAAGMVHFWKDASEKWLGITELSELIARHQDGAYRRVEAVQIGASAAYEPTLDEGQVKLIQLTEPPEEGVSEFVECVEISRRHPDAFALRVDGDSMTPRIADGDIVVLSPSQRGRDGATAVVQLRNQIGVTCKIIRRTEGKVHLIATNEKYETKIYDEDQLDWALAVLWRIRLG